MSNKISRLTKLKSLSRSKQITTGIEKINKMFSSNEHSKNVKVNH